jgi:hypothetical protein
VASPFPLEPGTVITIWRPAGTVSVPGKGSARQRFHALAWEGRIGQTVLLHRKGEPVGAGRLVSAIVADDGSGVTLTYEVLGLAA